jgi:hypothetical protein
MNHKTACALYGLSIDAFLQGLATEVEKPASFGLSEAQAVEVRRSRYLSRILEIRKKVA